jgi:anti-anti-sigma factor
MARMHHDEVADVHVGASLTVSTCQELRRTVREALTTHDTVRLWLDEIDHVDAPGLGLLVGLSRLANQLDASLICANPSVRVAAALRERGLDRVLRVCFVVDENGHLSAKRPA